MRWKGCGGHAYAAGRDTFDTTALHLQPAEQSRRIPSRSTTLPLCWLTHGSGIVQERLFSPWLIETSRSLEIQCQILLKRTQDRQLRRSATLCLYQLMYLETQPGYCTKTAMLAAIKPFVFHQQHGLQHD